MAEEKRQCVSITMTYALFQQLKAAAQEADQPLTVWCREAIKAKLNAESR